MATNLTRSWAVSIKVDLKDDASSGLQQIGREVRQWGDQFARLGDGMSRSMASAMAPSRRSVFGLSDSFMLFGGTALKILGAISSIGGRAFGALWDTARSVLGWMRDRVVGLGQSLLGLSRTIALVGGAMTGLLVRNALGAAMEMEAYMAKLQTALKDVQKAAELAGWAMTFSQQTPFEMGEVVDAAARLQAYGLDARKWIPLLGDMAGAMNKSLTQAVEAAADLFSGSGLERIKEFGITSTQLAAFGAGGKAGKLDYQSAEGLQRLRDAFEKLVQTRFGGGMERMMQTGQGALSNFKDAIWTFYLTVGQQLMPTFRQILAAGTQFVTWLRESGIAARVGATLGQVLAGGFVKLQAVVMKVVGFLMSPAGSAKIGQWWRTIVQTVTGAYNAIVKLVKEQLPQAFEAARACFESIVTKIALNWNTLVTNIGEGIAKAIDMFSGLLDALLLVGQTIEGLARTWIANMSPFLILVTRILKAWVDVYGRIAAMRGEKAGAQWAEDVKTSLGKLDEWLQDQARRGALRYAMGGEADTEWTNKWRAMKEAIGGAAQQVRETTHKLQIDISDPRTLETLLRSPLARQILREELRAYLLRTGVPQRSM